MISNCDDVRGMIPWLLNGTLEGEERRQVQQHLSTCERCRQELADTRLAAEIFDQHPPAAAITALAWGETPADVDPALLEEHVAACPRCSAELELARMSRQLEADERIVPLTARKPSSAPAAAPARTTAGWRGWKAAALAASLAGVVAFSGWFETAGRVRTLEERIAQQPAVVAPVDPVQAGPVQPGPTPPVAGVDSAQQQRMAELEAQLRKASEVLSAQEERIERLAQSRPAGGAQSGPQTYAAIREIQPSADVVRGTPAGSPTGVPAASPTVLLLTAKHQETHRGHVIEILDAGGKVAWNAAGVTRDPVYGLYALTLPAGTLPAGAYTIRVYGTGAGGSRELAESYSIRVE